MHEEIHDLETMLISYFEELDLSKIKFDKGKKVLDYPYLDSYWSEPDRAAFYIVHEGQIAGFVLINSWVVLKDFNADKSIADFYIKPEFRLINAGKEAAFKIFKKYEGKWEVKQNKENIGAVRFWRKVIKAFTGGEFSEVSVEQGEEGGEVIQLFSS